MLQLLQILLDLNYGHLKEGPQDCHGDVWEEVHREREQGAGRTCGV